MAFPLPPLLSLTSFALLSMPAIAVVSVALVSLRPEALAGAFTPFRPLPLIPLLILLSISLGHFILDPAWKFEHLCLSMAWGAIPALSWGNARSFETLLPRFLSVLWLCDGLLSLWQIGSGIECAGVPGNRNWHAALILMTTPFAAKDAFSILSGCKIPKFGHFAGAALIIIFSFALLLQCHSRGALLSLAAAAALALFLEAGRARRRLLLWMSGVAVAAATVLFVFKGVDPAAKAISDDVRLPLWEGTLDLVSSHPLLGVGAVSFESEFAPLRPPEYFFSRNVSVRTNHPHNHFLFIAATFGIAGLASWLFLLLFPMSVFAMRYKEEASLDMKMLFLCLSAMIVHSMFDLILYEWPTAPLSLAALGVIWGRVWPVAQEGFRTSPAMKALQRAASVLLALLAAISVLRSGVGAYFDRRAERLEGTSPEAAARLHDVAASVLKSEPLILYRAMTNAYMNVRNSDLALSCLELFDESPWRNFAHNNGFRGRCLALQGRLRDSIPYFIAESRNYPLQVLPLYNLAGVYWRLDMRDEARAAEGAVAALLKMKGLEMRHLQTIVESPDFDLKPWELLEREAGRAANE